jgi:hypothetical protein
MRAALVHAIDERAAAFYHRLGFETLMVPLTAVLTAIVGD